MPYALVRHKVEDYEKWKPVFDEDATNRKAGGSKGGYLFRNADDPNEILILFEWDELEKVRQFGQSDELRQKMQQAGVADRPDFYFLEEIERLQA
jgi:heme-degrading monooxygenase HmoA